MPDTDGSRIARLEERIEAVRVDVAEVAAEQLRERQRLHDLEGLAHAWTDAMREARRKEAQQYRRLTAVIAALAVVVAIAAIIVPLVVSHLAGK